eukprot:1551464-Pyramimonas_sp.AAC.1
MPWTRGAHGGRGERPPPAHPLWCRESAALAVFGREARVTAALGYHPLRTPFGGEASASDVGFLPRQANIA